MKTKPEYLRITLEEITAIVDDNTIVPIGYGKIRTRFRGGLAVEIFVDCPSANIGANKITTVVQKKRGNTPLFREGLLYDVNQYLAENKLYVAKAMVVLPVIRQPYITGRFYKERNHA